MEMAIDEDFYDAIQYEADELEILRERNQAPATYNVIKNVINWIIGSELKARIDYRILPRTKQGAQEAKTKTKIHKYIQDVNQGEFKRSRAFQECIKGGVGWLEYGARNPTLGNEIIYQRQEKWRNMWFDHLGLELDCSDWRFVLREKWVDLDIAKAMFPEREDDLRVLAEGVNSLYPYLPDDVVITDYASEFDLESDLDSLFGGPFDGVRERVKLVEMWYRMPDNVKIMRMVDEDTPYGALDGTIYRKDQEDHDYLVKGGYFTTFDTAMLTVRQAIWAGAIYLQDILTPYNHNRFPFVPMFCYRRQRDNMPYGVVRDLRDPQSALNKRKSKALFLLTAQQMIYEDGAINDPIKAREEMNRPDGQIVLVKGALQSGAFQRVEHGQLAQAHVALAEQDQAFIENTAAGITSENLGKTEKDLSGKAILALQGQGVQAQGVLFDNYYLAFQLAGDIVSSLIEQFYDQEREILITGDQSNDEFVEINKRTPEGIDNAIGREKSRFIVGKQDYRESIRMSMFETLSQLVQSLSQSMPQVALALLDLVIDYMDVLPNKDEMVERIRKINKQKGSEDDMTDEERVRAHQEQQATMAQQQAVQQIQMAMAKAELAIKQGEANQKNAQALQAQVDASMKKLEGFLKALEVAGIIRTTPQIVQAADALIAEAEKAPGGGNGEGRRIGQNQGGMQ